MSFSLLFQRLLRAAKLETAFYKEAKSDEKLTTEALIVVILAALALGVGLFLGILIALARWGGGFGYALKGLFAGILALVLGWAVFVIVAYFVGTMAFKGQGTLNQLMRTMGYAQAPMLLRVLIFIPVLGVIVSWLAWVWSLVASYVAARETLELDMTNAIITCVIAWVASGLMYGLVSLIFGFGFGAFYSGF